MSSTALVSYESARHHLAECTRIDDAKDISDKATALSAYARQKNDVELEAWVSQIKVRAAMRIGELSRELEKAAPLNGKGAGVPSGGKTKTAVLKAAGISTSAANRFEHLAEHADAVEAYIAKKVEQRKPVKFTEALAAVERAEREAKQRETLHRDPPRIATGLHVGDFRELAGVIPDESVELVFTDPPYDRDSIPLFGDAAKVAARILKPGGSFIAYCGQIQLPEVLLYCAGHLRYWWVLANVHAGKPNQMNKYGIKNHWKPLVWFVKGSRGDVQTFIPDTISGAREKQHHDWQQAESEASTCIELLTSPRGVVVDFFAGGGTTLVAAERLGRPWVAFEIDADAAGRSTKRLSRL